MLSAGPILVGPVTTASRTLVVHQISDRTQSVRWPTCHNSLSPLARQSVLMKVLTVNAVLIIIVSFECAVFGAALAALVDS